MRAATGCCDLRESFPASPSCKRSGTFGTYSHMRTGASTGLICPDPDLACATQCRGSIEIRLERGAAPGHQIAEAYENSVGKTPDHALVEHDGGAGSRQTGPRPVHYGAVVGMVEMGDRNPECVCNLALSQTEPGADLADVEHARPEDPDAGVEARSLHRSDIADVVRTQWGVDEGGSPCPLLSAETGNRGTSGRRLPLTAQSAFPPLTAGSPFPRCGAQWPATVRCHPAPVRLALILVGH